MALAREVSKEHLRASIKSMVELSQVTPLSDFFSQRVDRVFHEDSWPDKNY
jgi:hypothetical protein